MFALEKNRLILANIVISNAILESAQFETQILLKTKIQ